MNHQLEFSNMDNENETRPELLSIKEAAEWASHYLKKTVTISQISYLVNYGRINAIKKNVRTLLNINELKNYYNEKSKSQNAKFLNKLSKDINISLAFDQYNESERTKHVHRLHPYKGKFIPQLVEYFLDNHTDEFKEDIFFHPSDIVLDPFAGSGTTLIQASELGINSIGIELSAYNTIITRTKIEKYPLNDIKEFGDNILRSLYEIEKMDFEFYRDLEQLITQFNEQHFPSPQYRKSVYSKEIDEKSFGKQKMEIFNLDYHKLLKKYNKPHPDESYSSKSSHNFLEIWFTEPIQKEIQIAKTLIQSMKDEKIKALFMVILGRSVRSCRATKHIDLASLIKPQFTPYYCERKHFKICRPVESLSPHFKKYLNDSIKRIEEFSKLRSKESISVVIEGDSSQVDLKNKEELKFLFERTGKSKIDGIFTSPPYVGQIDYHEQHQYSYEIFDLPEKKADEIGTLKLGKSKKAKELYSEAIIKVFKNLKPYLKESAHCFIVANDKFNLYSHIIKEADYELVKEFKRPVLNRVERDRQAYEESIFHIVPSE